MKEKPLLASPSPFVSSGLRLEVANMVVFLTLLAQVVMMIAFKDTRSLLVLVASCIGAALAELCFAVAGLKEKTEKYSDGEGDIHGLVAGFLLPSSINPLLAAVASFFGLFVSRNFFNGRRNSWISASAISVIFAFVSAPACFEAAAAFPTDAALARIPEFDRSISELLNRSVFRPLGVFLPEGYVQLLFNPHASVPAFKFGIATILSSIILIALNIIDWIAPAAFATVYSLCVFFFSQAFAGPLPYPLYPANVGGNILFALFSSGVFFAAVYMLADFPALPRTRPGRLALGVVAGVVAFFVCGRGGGSAIGAALAVFAANLAALAIEYVEDEVLHRLSLRMRD